MNTSNIFIDFHVHLYQTYKISAVEKKLVAIANLFDVNSIGFLHTNRGSGLEFELNELSGWESVNQNTCKKSIGNITIWGYIGSQLVSSEGLEFQTFYPNVYSAPISLLDHLSTTNEATILNYSTGKWFGKRGEIIKEILKSKKLSSKVILSDTTSRFLPSSILNSNFPIIAGTDPLPLAFEELIIGDYGCLVRTENPGDLNEIIQKIFNKEFFITGRKMSKVRAILRELKLKM